jgi:phage-related minor tail protein
MGGGYLGTLAIKLTAEIDQLRQRLAQGENLTKAFSAAAVAAFLAVSAAAFAAGLQIDDAMDNIRISTGATGTALAGLEDSFNRVFANVPSSAGDASTAVAQLSVRTGQTGVALENLSSQVLTLARITKSDLNATVEDSAKVFQGWGIAAADQAGTLDMVLRASQATGVTVSSLLQTMVTAGPVFRAAGYDFATSAALIGGFEKAGVNGQRAVASLTAAFRFFGKEGIDAKKGIADTIARIQELGPGAASAALGVKVFGRSAVDMVAAIQSGRLNVDGLVASITNGSETIETAAKATDGFTETLQLLRQNAVLALEPFGTAILKTFNTAMVGILAPSKALLTTLNLLAQAAIALTIAIGTRLVVAFAAATRAKIADFIAAQAARVAAVQHTAAVAAQAQAQFVAATAALNAARAETALTGSLVAQRAALVAVRTAHVQAAAATAAHTAAMNAASISARLAAGSMNLLKGAMAFFGGPWGLAITAVLTAVGIAFYNTGRKAREAAAEAKQAADDFRAALGAMDEATFGAVATTQRYNYSVLEKASIEATQRLEQQRATVARMSQQAGTDQFGEVRITPELREAQNLLSRHEQKVREITLEWGATAANVRSVKEHEAALARQRAAMPDPNTGGGPGTLDWEGANAAAAQTDAQTLRNRVALLTEVFETEKEQGRSTATVLAELNRLWVDAATNLRAMGDATRLDDADIDKYREWLGIVQQIQNANIAGPAAVRAAPAAALNTGVTVVPLLTSAERFARIVKASAADFGSTITQKMANASASFKTAIVEGASEAADRMRDASDNVRGMWSNLLAGLPEQLGNFIGMFNALKEERAAGGGGIAPIPGAIAFTLAMEAIAPILEALREPFAALMVPIQMLAQAFGPLLTSLLKAFFPIFKQFGIAVTYVAQAAGYVGGALFKVIGEIIRTVGSLISKIPGLGQEGNAIKNFGKGLTDASKEMFDMAKAMPGVREELKNLDWDEAMKRASESADRLSDSLSNVPEIFDLIARRTQVMRGQAPSPSSSVRALDVSMAAPAPSPSSQQTTGAVVQKHVTLEIHPGAFVVNGGDPRQVETQLRKFKDDLISDLNGYGTSPLQAAVRRQATAPAY